MCTVDFGCVVGHAVVARTHAADSYEAAAAGRNTPLCLSRVGGPACPFSHSQLGHAHVGMTTGRNIGRQRIALAVWMNAEHGGGRAAVETKRTRTRRYLTQPPPRARALRTAGSYRPNSVISCAFACVGVGEKTGARGAAAQRSVS